ncbi:dihydroorotase [Ekhidna sp.]
MSLLLKNVLVVDCNSQSHLKQVNLLIEKGKISSLTGKSAKKEIDLTGKIVTCGWFDLNANFNDPGFEYREDIDSGSKLAQAGGFTDVCLMPGTMPPITSKSDVGYIIKKSNQSVDLHVTAALSEDMKGENLNEILDLIDAGACSFSEGDMPIWNSELLLKALQYTSSIDVPIFQNSRDLNISSNTHMHEGRVSTNLGLRGEPPLSEELIVQRDIEILKYSGGRLHFSKITSGKSLELIKRGKKEGLSITCDIGLHHLIFEDNSIESFDTNMKSLPPYRNSVHRKALLKGLKDGTIDAICSNHRPLEQEVKQLEFDLAEPGNISIQTFFPSLLKLAEDIPLEILIDKIVNGPRKVLRLDPVKIAEGEEAKLTICDEDLNWFFDEKTNLSKSKNSPFWNMQLRGKVVGTVNREFLTLN